MAEKFLTYNNKLIVIDGKLLKVDFDQTNNNKTPETKTVTPTTTQQTIVPTNHNYELVSVIVEPIETEEKTATQNGEYTPSDGKYISKFTVNVPVSDNLISQEKTITPTITEQVVTPDTGHKLTKVTVGAVTSSIDSNIIANNIKSGVSILGVVGTLDPNNMDITYDQSTGTLILNHDGNSIKSNPLVVENASEMSNYLTSDYVGIIIHYIGETTSEYTQKKAH